MGNHIERITVMGGAGHVGLPMALALTQAGFEVILYDTNEAALELIEGGRMPFQEEGAEELLQRWPPPFPVGRRLRGRRGRYYPSDRYSGR
jgi:UDP-N-acetyl-D-mannosaminuronate dehydrogenase